MSIQASIADAADTLRSLHASVDRALRLVNSLEDIGPVVDQVCSGMEFDTVMQSVDELRNARKMSDTCTAEIQEFIKQLKIKVRYLEIHDSKFVELVNSLQTKASEPTISEKLHNTEGGLTPLFSLITMNFSATDTTWSELVSDMKFDKMLGSRSLTTTQNQVIGDSYFANNSEEKIACVTKSIISLFGRDLTKIRDDPVEETVNAFYYKDLLILLPWSGPVKIIFNRDDQRIEATIEGLFAMKAYNSSYDCVARSALIFNGYLVMLGAESNTARGGRKERYVLKAVNLEKIWKDYKEVYSQSECCSVLDEVYDTVDICSDGQCIFAIDMRFNIRILGISASGEIYAFRSNALNDRSRSKNSWPTALNATKNSLIVAILNSGSKSLSQTSIAVISKSSLQLISEFTISQFRSHIHKLHVFTWNGVTLIACLAYFNAVKIVALRGKSIVDTPWSTSTYGTNYSACTKGNGKIIVSSNESCTITLN
jgi:hypothetical protein